MKVRVTKVNEKDRPKCKCGEHFLELCTGFDGEQFSFERYCYLCGKKWSHKENIEKASEKPKGLVEIPKPSRPQHGDFRFEYDDGSVRYFQQVEVDCPRVGDLIFVSGNGEVTIKQGTKDVLLSGRTLTFSGIRGFKAFPKPLTVQFGGDAFLFVELIDKKDMGAALFIVKEVFNKKHVQYRLS